MRGNQISGVIFSIWLCTIQAFNITTTTMHMIRWADNCVQRYPLMALPDRNAKADMLESSWSMAKDIWENEFMVELFPQDRIHLARMPIASQSCNVDCDDPGNTSYFETVLGLQRYGLGDAIGMMQICRGVSPWKHLGTDHVHVILNAPMNMHAGFAFHNMIQLSDTMLPVEGLGTVSKVRGWAGVLLHEFLHVLGILHTWAPPPGSDVPFQYGCFADIMGSWSDAGFNKTHFLNPLHRHLLGLADNLSPSTAGEEVILSLSPTSTAILQHKKVYIDAIQYLELGDMATRQFGANGLITSSKPYIRAFKMKDDSGSAELVLHFPVEEMYTCVPGTTPVMPNVQGLYVSLGSADDIAMLCAMFNTSTQSVHVSVI